MLLQQLFEESKYSSTEEQYKFMVKSFRKDTKVTHKDIEKLAKHFGLSVEDMQLKIYDVLGDVLRNIGKHNDIPDDKFDAKQLEMGIKIESEHTKDPAIAKMIAKDHLTEHPEYYTILKKAKL